MLRPARPLPAGHRRPRRSQEVTLIGNQEDTLLSQLVRRSVLFDAGPVDFGMSYNSSRLGANFKEVTRGSLYSKVQGGVQHLCTITLSKLVKSIFTFFNIFEKFWSRICVQGWKEKKYF